MHPSSIQQATTAQANQHSNQTK